MVTEPQILGVRREADAVDVRLRIPAGLRYLRGHFPGVPIVPGVVLLKWAMDLAQQQFKLPPEFKRLSAIKFMRVMPLDTEVLLRLRCTAGELSFEYLDAGRSCVTGRVHCA